MPDPATFDVRLQRALVRIDAQPPGSQEADALSGLRRSLESTLARLAAGGPGTSVFHFQVSGGRGMLFQGSQAVPMEATRLSRLLNSMDVEIQFGEVLDVDGALAGWLILPEVTVTDTNLRHAEDALRGMKSGRDRDHAAFQAADTQKVRLRSRLTLLVSALQAAQRETPGAP